MSTTKIAGHEIEVPDEAPPAQPRYNPDLFDPMRHATPSPPSTRRAVSSEDLPRDRNGAPIGRWRIELSTNVSIPMGPWGSIVDGKGECVGIRAARVLGAFGPAVISLAPADQATIAAIRAQCANMVQLRARAPEWLALLDEEPAQESEPEEATQVRARRRELSVSFDATAGERFRALCEQVLTLNQLVSACRLAGLQGSRATAKSALVDRLVEHYREAGSFPGDDFDPPDDWRSIPARRAAPAAAPDATAPEALEAFGVTPAGGNDTPAIRAWLAGEATAKGWTDLQWRDETDAHGLAMGRLLGKRPRKAPIAPPFPPTESAPAVRDDAADALIARHLADHPAGDEVDGLTEAERRELLGR